MTLPDEKRSEADRDLKRFCMNLVPPEYRNQLRFSYRFRGNDVTLFRESPTAGNSTTEWATEPVARFRYDTVGERWSVSWQRTKRRWLYCDWIGQKERFSEVLAGVERDAYGTFFG